MPVYQSIARANTAYCLLTKAALLLAYAVASNAAMPPTECWSRRLDSSTGTDAMMPLKGMQLMHPDPKSFKTLFNMCKCLYY